MGARVREIHFTLHTLHKYNSESANNYFSTCLHLNWRDVRLLQLYKFGCANTRTHTQHARTQGNTHRPSAVSAAKCSCFSSISAHFRFAAWRRHSILCFRRFSPILSVLFLYFILVFLLRWHWHKVYCISNCDAANIFSSDSRILIARLRFLSPHFYRATQKKNKKTN